MVQMANATTSTSTILALFESRIAAEKAVGGLVNAGFSRDEISIVTHDPRTPGGDTPNIGPQEQIGSGNDASAGAALGGLAGFIGGIVALAIPGIGPILAAGPLAAGIMGAGIGAAAGGIAGALREYGVPEADATRFSDALRRGRALVSAHVPADRSDEASEILDSFGALDVDETYGHPSTQSEPTEFKPVTPEALEAAKLKPGEGLVDKHVRRRRSSLYPGVTGMGATPNS